MMVYRAPSPAWRTANDRFKSRSENWMSIGVIVAVILHGALFALFPEMNALVVIDDPDEATVVELPPPVDIPPPPEDIPRPATPTVAAEPLGAEGVFPENRFEDHVPMAPPRPAPRADVREWIPHDVAPRLENGRALQRVLQQRYPPMLREAGIGGTVTLDVFVDVEGRPVDARVHESSGYPQLDAVAEEVADRMEFSPALNRDKPVAVWARTKVVFTVR